MDDDENKLNDKEEIKDKKRNDTNINDTGENKNNDKIDNNEKNK